MGKSNTVVSTYTMYRHVQQYCSHPSIQETVDRTENTYIDSVVVYQKYLTRFAELINIEPWLINFYHTIPTFDEPEKEAFENIVGIGENVSEMMRDY